MIRALDDEARQGEVWGVDISATPIHWCKTHLSPPFRFATTTTIPHLLFPDGFFDLVYAASVFTHVEDLADAWLCEVRRILAPAGRAYVTIHDDSTMELLNSVYADHWLGQMVRSSPAYQDCGGRYGMLVIDRDTASQVFYSREFFLRTLAPTFEVLGVHPGVHGYQTAYVLRPKSCSLPDQAPIASRRSTIRRAALRQVQRSAISCAAARPRRRASSWFS